MIANSSKYFLPSESQKFNRFLSYLHLLESIDHRKMLPDILFELAFPTYRNHRNDHGHHHKVSKTFPALLSQSFPKKHQLHNEKIALPTLDNNESAYLLAWQDKFFTFPGSHVAKFGRSDEELLIALEEIQFTRFEYDLAHLIVNSLLEGYNYERFKREFAEISGNCDWEVETSETVIKWLSDKGLLSIFVTLSENPFVKKLIRGINIFSRHQLPAELQRKIVRYIESLHFLHPIWVKLSIPEFDKLHNHIFLAYFIKLTLPVDDSPISLSEEHRQALGDWADALLEHRNALMIIPSNLLNSQN